MKMSTDKELDQKIAQLLNGEEAIPNSIKIKKEQAYKEIREMSKQSKKVSNKKKWMVAASAVVVGALTMGTPIFAEFAEKLFGGSYSGVQSAVNEGYIQETTGIESESNGIKLELLNVVKDPTIIQLSYRLSSEDPKVLKGFKYDRGKGNALDQFTIIDDKGRVLQAIDEEGTYTVPFIDEKGEKQWLVSSVSQDVREDLEHGQVYFDILLSSTQGNYDDIQGLSIQTNKIGNLEGDWQLDVVFDEQMVQVSKVQYEAREVNDKIEILSAEALPTGLKIDFLVKVPIDESIVSNAKVVDRKGNSFSAERGGWMENTEEGERVILTYDVLESELQDEFEFMVEDIDGQTETITLSILEKN